VPTDVPSLKPTASWNTRRWGPAWLKQSQIAGCVAETILDGDRVRALYSLIAFVVMPNHVHLLIEPKAPAPKITQYVKGVSARRANELLRELGSRSGKMSLLTAGSDRSGKGRRSFVISK
jgi:REP element-mobilizing transposase RayT